MHYNFIITNYKELVKLNNNYVQQANSFQHCSLNQINSIANKQPNTVPVQWPQLTAVNTTPYVNGGFYGNSWNNFGNGFWGNDFGNNVIF